MYSGKVIAIRQMRLYSGRSNCIRAKVVVFGQIVLFGQKWLYSGKVAAFGQGGCIREKVVVFG